MQEYLEQRGGAKPGSGSATLSRKSQHELASEIQWNERGEASRCERVEKGRERGREEERENRWKWRMKDEDETTFYGGRQAAVPVSMRRDNIGPVPDYPNGSDDGIYEPLGHITKKSKKFILFIN